MANLSNPQAIKLIKEPANRRELQKAIAKRLRHKLHTETEDLEENAHLGEAHQIFLRWVKGILEDEDNFKRFQQLYRPPLYTNELVESIYSQFQRIFEANDAFERVEFDDPDLVNDFTQYRKSIGDMSFWETQGYESFQTSIDNIIVVDLPKLKFDQATGFEQLSEFPEPYYFMLDIASVIDISNRKIKATDTLTGKPFYYFKTEYLIFWESEAVVCVFDDTYYRTFQWSQQQDPVLISEVPHNLGFTPARSFWTTPLNSTSRIQKKSPITKSLSELDWLLFVVLGSRYLKEYAMWPIYAMYKSSCNYKDVAKSLICNGGFLAAIGSKPGEHSGEKCPKCKNAFKPGPGKIAYMPIPQDKEQYDLMSNPFKVIPAESESIDVVNKEIAMMRKNIYESCVGIGSDIVGKEAVNEDQVKAGFETKENVLIGVKRNFEIAHEFVLDTIARLRYGDRYKSTIISYGTQFFIPDESEEVDDYKSAVESGMSESELDMRRDDISSARYRNNPDQLERIKILKAIDPFPDKNIKAVLEVKELTDPIDVIIKMNFIRFIERFERENVSLLVFGRKIDYDKKITQITDVFRYYALEYQALTKQSIGSGGAAPGGDTLDTPIDIEAEAKANLKGSVGGVQGILGIQAAVAKGETDYEAAVSVLIEIYGFDDAKSKAMLGPKPTKKQPPAPAPHFG